MLYSNYTKQRNGKTWETYRKQRNLVNKLKKNSMKNYFLERCSGGSKPCDFWKTMEPFFSKKSNSGEQKLVLNENSKIVNDTKQVTEHFNTFFSTVTEKIGNGVAYDQSTHSSILEIRKHSNPDISFEFQKTTTEKIEKIVNKINIKKATGCDGIPAKIVKHSRSVFAAQLTDLINLSVDSTL